MSGVDEKLDVGTLVTLPNELGIGRVGAVAGERVKVEYLDSVAAPAQASEWVDRKTCRRVVLQNQTRVFWQDPEGGYWRAGRIVGNDGDRYYVRPPNSESDIILAERDIRVRWDRPVGDPVDTLLAGANETPYFRDARLPFLKSLIEQRGACAGMTALMSSAVEIHPHQVTAALTVLSDPVQRYLIADEVGLGKTIEAGLVIRQLLLDNPRSRIVVIAPDVLRRQWLKELREKFHIEEFTLAEIKISAHENPERWKAYHGFDLVVIDEADQLVEVDDPEHSPYREVRSLVHSCPRVLLLSATPATRRLNTHLGLLHLLDKDLYKWADREQFRARFEQRKQLATYLYALTADEGFEVLLPSVIEDIMVLTPQDARLAELADTVRELLTVDGELREDVSRTGLEAAVEALRAHISETYRLHRRVIRHRRAKVLTPTDDPDVVPFEVSGRRRPQPVPLDSSQQQAGKDVLLDWQAEMSAWLLDTPEAGTFTELGRALAVLTSRAGGSLTDLLDAFRWRLDGDQAAADRAGLTGDERMALAAPPVRAVERRLLEPLSATSAGSGARELAESITPILKAVSRPVVFCGPGALCVELCTELSSIAPKGRVLEHSRRVGPEMSEQAVSKWRDEGGILVVDATAEAGLNLQQADTVIHCRLPWSPNRLEQVLGRVDRYTSTPGKPAAQYTVVSADDDIGFGDAWLALLDEGFDIFRQSVSALQDAIDGALPSLWKAAAEDGPEGLLARRKEVVELLKQERKEIDGMDMLESVHESPGGLRDIAAAVSVFESEGWREFDTALTGYAGSDPGGLRFIVRRGPGFHPLVEFERKAGAPLLMPPRMFALSKRSLKAEQLQGFFNRTAVLRRPGTQLYRVGQPFVDLLAQVAVIDDRGQASAFWRRATSRSTEPEVYACFDYLVEADVAEVLHMVGGSKNAELALKRQADRILAPFLRRVWLGADGGVVNDQRLLALLGKPYDPRRGDVNLNHDRIGALYEIYGGREQFALDMRALRERAREELERVTDLTQRCREAQRQARRAVAIGRTQAEARKAAGRLINDTESHLMDVQITEALVEGLSKPKVSPVSVTVLVLGDYKDKN